MMKIGEGWNLKSKCRENSVNARVWIFCQADAGPAHWSGAHLAGKVCTLQVEGYTPLRYIPLRYISMSRIIISSNFITDAMFGVEIGVSAASCSLSRVRHRNTLLQSIFPKV